MFRFAASLLSLIALSGCASAGQNFASLGNLPAVVKYDIKSEAGEIADAQGSWVIKDRAFESMLMIRPTHGRLEKDALRQGTRFKWSDNRTEYEAAASLWLSSQHRQCRITDGRRLGVTNWEFDYQCITTARE